MSLLQKLSTKIEPNLEPLSVPPSGFKQSFV